MRTVTVAVLAILVGCTDDDATQLGDVKVVDDGGTRAFASACLDADFLDCNGEDTTLVLNHEGIGTPMPFEGFLFPLHQCEAPLVDPITEFDITDGRLHARMFLPPRFELDRLAEEIVELSSSDASTDSVTVSWERGDSPMRWDVEYTCDMGGGGAVGEDIDDGDGRLVLFAKQLVDRLPEDRRGDTTCVFTVKLSRVQRGKMDDDFPATLATGIQQRSFGARVVP